MKVGRVIARPFIGDCGNFKRTKNRRDYAIEPPSPTLNDWVQGAGRRVYGIGKIGDIFSRRGIDEVRKGSDAELMEHLADLVGEAEDGSLTFANFVEFDSLYGHPRDVSGYARALEWFDSQLPRMFDKARQDDLFIFTADHGNDPTWVGTDHTRERVPVVGYGLGDKPIGLIGFSDVGASVASYLDVAGAGTGKEFSMSVSDLPKVELHLHLEGAAPPAFIRGLAKEKSMDISGIFAEDGSYAFTDFWHFLKVYEAATATLQTPEDYYRLTLAVLQESAASGVVYSETFLSPDFCGGRDVGAWREYLHAIKEAAVAAEKADGIVLKGIVTAIRHFGPDKGRETALCAAETAE